MPTVTVITSVHETGQWLAEAGLSLVCQLCDWEWLIAANGREEWDRCTYVASLIGERARVYTREPVWDLHRSLNGLIQQARGQYLVRLDPDDAFAGDALGAMVDAAAGLENPLVYGHYADFTEYEPRAHIWQARAATLRNLWQANITSYCVLARTEFVKALGGYRGLGYEDWDLTIRLLAHGCQPVNLKRVVLRHRVRSDGRLAALTKQHERHLAELRAANREIFAGVGLCE